MITGVLFWLFVFLIVYTYLGYPLLLALLARLRPKPHFYSSDPPALTLLIAAYNEEKVIARKIENSLSLNYPRDQLQILVAADGSDDRTAGIVRQYAGRGVELSYVPERQGKMAAINRAVEKAQGEIVIFSDANNMYETHALWALVAPFSDPDVGAVTGAKYILRGGGTLGASEGLYWKYESFIREQETRLGCCTGVVGELLAVRKSLFAPPPRRVINDDFYIAMQIIRSCYRVIYAPQAKSFESISMTAYDEVKRRSRIVAGRYQAIAMAPRLLSWKRPLVVWQVLSHKFLRPLVPFAMLGAFLANLAALIWPPAAGGAALLRLATPFNLLFFGLQIAFYLLAWAGSFLRRESKIGKLLYLPAFLVNSNLAAVMGLYTFATGRQTVLWQRVNRQDDIVGVESE
jgi:cellulose synthase/poly-beta-1,6-N-acetylglucosamine synthase-like glycosyltransferase